MYPGPTLTDPASCEVVKVMDGDSEGTEIFGVVTYAVNDNV